MHDDENAVDMMSPADAAVTYLLNRIQVDPDLRWLMLNTEAFTKLCVAEAARLGEAVEAVTERREHDRQPSHRRHQPRLVEFRRIVQEIRDLDGVNHDDKLTDLLEEASRL